MLRTIRCFKAKCTRYYSSIPFKPYALAPTIHEILFSATPETTKEVQISGWIKSIRKQKRVAFAVVTDGSSGSGIQAVFGQDVKMDGLTNGTAVSLKGTLKLSPGRGQSHELVVSSVNILGACPPDTYPIQKQALTTEYLRENISFRTRTNEMAAVMRLRRVLAQGIRTWMEGEGRGFTEVHTPIMTSSDAEGAGEVFRILAGKDDTFFQRQTYLTVSAQLHLEAFAHSLGRVYTLSPCFRAEKSDTSRHLAEFWMLEAEWNENGDERGNTAFIESMIRAVVQPLVAENAQEDIYSKRTLRMIQEDVKMLNERLEDLKRHVDPLTPAWPRVTFMEAIEILKDSPYNETDGKTDLSSEQEQYLAAIHFKSPVFITDYPKQGRPFYMRVNRDPSDSSRLMDTVMNFDLIVPVAGELAGGSAREESVPVLLDRMRESGVVQENNPLEWLLNLRNHGSAPHTGFGLGFERLVMWVGGVGSVRECVGIPRWTGRGLL